MSVSVLIHQGTMITMYIEVGGDPSGMAMAEARAGACLATDSVYPED